MGCGATPISELALYIVAVGIGGYLFGWWEPTTAIYAFLVAGLLYLVYLFLLWLGSPVRYKDQAFADFGSYLETWPTTLDNGGRIFIEPDEANIPRLRFRVAGRGHRKRLLVRLPTRKSIRADLQRTLEALTTHFDAASIRLYPRSIELRLPARAAYTSSVASRAAEATFRLLGCTDESRYTIHGYGDIDPHYELEIAEQAAEATSGWLKRYFERRARAIRSALSRPRTPPDDPRSRD